MKRRVKNGGSGGAGQALLWDVIEGGGGGAQPAEAAQPPALLAVAGREAPTDFSFEAAMRRGFDIVTSNPPYGVSIKDAGLVSQYRLGRSEDGKRLRASAASEVLFMEALVRVARPGGRILSLVCDSLLSNSGTQYVRDFIGEACRLRCVISLSEATFKPFTNVKTSVLFFQPWTGAGGENPRLEDYPIAMAISEDAGRDRQGRLRYVRDEGGAARAAGDVAETFARVREMVAEIEGGEEGGARASEGEGRRREAA